MHVLLIDGETSCRARVSAWVSAWGHTVVGASDVDKAQAVDGGEAAELVLLRADQAREAGEQRLLELRAGGSGGVDRFVLLYGWTADEGLFREGWPAGVDDVLQGPMGEPALEGRVRMAGRVLAQRKALLDQNASLSRLNEQLVAALRTIQSDLEAASVLQLSQLPNVSEVHPTISLHWMVLPSNFLAGDTLNYFMVQERYLVFYHLDVAGHGVPSALLSVTLSQLLSPQPGSPMMRYDAQRELKRIVPAVDVVSELNRRFQPQGNGYFTMVYGIFDTVTREIRLCQAGHPSPLKVGLDGTVSTVGEGGFPVALWPEMTYEETRLLLLAGERLVLYSDGILACVTPEGEPFSLEQFQSLLRLRSADSANEVLQGIQMALEEWSQGSALPDDVSVLILESR